MEKEYMRKIKVMSMNMSCPKCHSGEFYISDKVLGGLFSVPEYKNYECCKCGHTWVGVPPIEKTSEQLVQEKIAHAFNTFLNEINRDMVDYAGNCITYTFASTNPEGFALPPADPVGTPLEFFAHLILEGYTKEKLINMIPLYLDAMDKSEAFKTLMSELLKRGK